MLHPCDSETWSLQDSKGFSIMLCNAIMSQSARAYLKHQVQPMRAKKCIPFFPNGRCPGVRGSCCTREHHFAYKLCHNNLSSLISRMVWSVWEHPVFMVRDHFMDKWIHYLSHMVGCGLLGLHNISVDREFLYHFLAKDLHTESVSLGYQQQPYARWLDETGPWIF